MRTPGIRNRHTYSACMANPTPTHPQMSGRTRHQPLCTHTISSGCRDQTWNLQHGSILQELGKQSSVDGGTHEDKLQFALLYNQLQHTWAMQETLLGCCKHAVQDSRIR